MKAGKHIGSLWQEFKAFAFKGNMIDLAVAVVIGAAFSGVINSLVKDIIMPSVIYVSTTVNTVAKKTVDVAEKTAAVVGVTSKPAETQPATTQPAMTQPAAAPPAAEPSNVSPVPGAGSRTEADFAAAVVTAIDKAMADKAAVERVAAEKEAAEKASTKPVQLDWKIGPVNIGSFIGELLNFVLIAAAVFIVIVKLLGSVMKKVGGTPAPSEPTTKECPFCLSVIPIKARKCAHCTADQPASPTAGAMG